MACWITFFADGARRNSSRCVLYSRFGDPGFLCADGMIILLRDLYGKPPCLATIGSPARSVLASSPLTLFLFCSISVPCRCSRGFHECAREESDGRAGRGGLQRRLDCGGGAEEATVFRRRR